MIDYLNNGFKNKKIDIDITNKCTLQCRMCARRMYDNPSDIPGGDLSIESFQKVLDYFDQIYFCGSFGDPIFNPNIKTFLWMCDEQNKEVHVHTAASHKPMHWYEEAFESNPNAIWHFGIDGLPYQSFVYRENQDGEYLFDVMLKAKSKGVKVIWQYLVFGYNQDKVEDARKLAEQHNIEIEIHHTSRYDDFLKPTVELVKEKRVEYDFIPKCLTDKQEKYPYLSATGQLYPCCWLDSTQLTDEEFASLNKDNLNIKYNTIDEIINSDEWREFYGNLKVDTCPSFCKQRCSTNLKNPGRIVE